MQNFTKIYKEYIIRNCVVVLFLVAATFTLKNANAQTDNKIESQVEQVKKHYYNKEFDKALKLSKNILLIDSENYVAHRILAEIYKEQKVLDEEIFHSEKALQVWGDTTLFFSLGEAYYKKGNYSESLYFYEKYSDYRFIPEKRRFLLACKMASCQFSIQGINSSADLKTLNSNQNNLSDFEYWPTPTKDGKRLVFHKIVKDSSLLSSQDIFISEFDSVGGIQSSEVIKLAKTGNQKIIKKGNEPKIVFFTACNREDGIGDCDIYFSRLVNGKWTEPRNAGNQLNSEYWDAQATFSDSSQQLYFSSNRTGGVGGRDIWRAKLLGFSEEGAARWEKPKNLGQLVNTLGDEISPYFYVEDRILYFASDKHIGMGGLDLFSTAIDKYGNFKSLENLGHPINTIENEFGVSLNTIMDTAYFAVGRSSDSGNVIFAFNKVRGLPSSADSYVKVKVSNGKTNKALTANVELLDRPSTSGNLELKEVDESGEIMFCIPVNRTHTLNVTKPGYLFHSETIVVSEKHPIKKPLLVKVQLKPIEVGAEIELYNIYYEVDSYAILPNSETELQKLVTFLKNNKSVKVEIQGHTDSTGISENNLNLSNLRAKSIVNYLKKNELETARLKFAGYGDTQPIATNETEEGRQLNRRTTVKIVEN